MDVNDHRLRIYDSMLELLSSADNPTPMVQLRRVVPYEQTRVFAKLEWYNPFGAVKDRVAANLVHDAEERGVLDDVKKLVEPTSGNTGMGLAMVANAKGYRLRTPLSTAIPAEKRAVLRFFGCDVVELSDSLCPAPGAPEGAIASAMETAARPDYHMLDQYSNWANAGAHYRTTGPEIWKQTGGKVTHFVASLGTCGTVTGTGRFLKEQNPDVQVIGVHPAEGHDIPGVRSIRQLAHTKLFSPDEYDDLIEVNNEEAFGMCLRLNREESIIAGPSSGMALAGLLKLVRDQPDAVVAVIFPDNIFKYASSIQRHFPGMFAGMAGASSAPSEDELLLAQLISNADNEFDTIEIDELCEGGVERVFVDVRDPGSYETQHIVGAVNVPVEDLRDGHPRLPADRGVPIAAVCTRGVLSIRGTLILKSLGYRDVRSVNGGTNAWAERGLPTESGPRPQSA